MAKILDVIKYEGDNSTFIWKHPVEDFNMLSQLIVNESQEAIFYMDGQALDMFGPGRYTLDSQNIPLLGKLLNKFTGGESMFHCQVYFINKSVQMGLKWGTPSKVRFIEPTYGIPIEIGACGEMNLMVSDSRKLLVKLVGTMSGIAWEQHGDTFAKSIKDSFRPLVVNEIRRLLPTSIKAQSIDILEIDEHLAELSEELRKNVLAGFEEYGLTIPQFYITDVMLPEDDKNFQDMRNVHLLAVQKMKKANQLSLMLDDELIKTEQLKREEDRELIKTQRLLDQERMMTESEINLEQKKAEAAALRAKAEAERQVTLANADAVEARLKGFTEAEVMQAKGYNQKDVFQTEVQKAYAEGIGHMGGNGGGGGLLGDMVGLGVGMAAAGTMSSQMGDMFKGFMNPMAAQAPAQPSAQAPAQQESAMQCSNCGKPLPPNAKFCLECGTKVEVLDPNEMICPQCGQKTQKGKFCMECGASLVSKCPNCGTELPPNGKFCLECGTKIGG